MTDVEASFEDFNASQRTGRRNAIYEIPQGLGGPGPAELDAAAPLHSGNKPGDVEQDAAETEDTAAAEEETKAEGS